MCMEDIRLGRSLASRARNVVAVDSTNTVIASADTRRTRLVVQNTTITECYIVPEGCTVGVQTGFFVDRTLLPLVIDIETYGPIVCGTWYAFASGDNANLVVIESTLEKQ